MHHAILIGCLAAFGVIISILVLMAAGYLWWRHKRSQLIFVEPTGDEESSYGSMPFPVEMQEFGPTSTHLPQTQQQQQQQAETSTSSASVFNKKLNGLWNFKSPFGSGSGLICCCTRSCPPSPVNGAAVGGGGGGGGGRNGRSLGGCIRFGRGSGDRSQTGDSETGLFGNLTGALSKDKAKDELTVVDIFADNTEPSENVGQIQFSIEYDFDANTLILRVVQGKELPAKDLNGSSDPYVRVTLLPDKKHRLETKVKRRTLNPRWNETFYFEGFTIQKLHSRTLHLHVFDYDRFSKDDSIGEVFLPLCQVDFSQKPAYWKALKPPAKDKCGEILIGLCYHPATSVLTLTLNKARHLKAKDINGKSDPYVKVWLQFGDKRVEKRKTPIFKCTLNPNFSEAFVFNVPWEKIRECSLDVMVMDFDNIGRNELIGRIMFADNGVDYSYRNSSLKEI